MALQYNTKSRNISKLEHGYILHLGITVSTDMLGCCQFLLHICIRKLLDQANQKGIEHIIPIPISRRISSCTSVVTVTTSCLSLTASYPTKEQGRAAPAWTLWRTVGSLVAVFLGHMYSLERGCAGTDAKNELAGRVVLLEHHGRLRHGRTRPHHGLPH